MAMSSDSERFFEFFRALEFPSHQSGEYVISQETPPPGRGPYRVCLRIDSLEHKFQCPVSAQYLRGKYDWRRCIAGKTSNSASHLKVRDRAERKKRLAWYRR